MLDTLIKILIYRKSFPSKIWSNLGKHLSERPGYELKPSDILLELELEKVAHGVETELRLQPVGIRTLPANLKDGARSDIVPRGFWSPLDKSYFNVRVLHPGALSNEKKTLEIVIVFGIWYFTKLFH